ncbi:MAG: MarR family transcriptional regulator [Burkholderiaceae bacterium]|nr:MarR family transcriptional regulator [Burkholderiaceae bacterium]
MRGADVDYMLADSIGYQLRLAGVLARRHYVLRLAEAGLTGVSPEQITLLSFLDREDGWALGQLAAANGQDKAAVTRMAQTMEAAGWIRIDPDPEHGSRKRVCITAAGRRLHARVEAVTARKEREFDRQLTRGERRTLLALIARLRDGLAQMQAGPV